MVSSSDFSTVLRLPRRSREKSRLQEPIEEKDEGSSGFEDLPDGYQYKTRLNFSTFIGVINLIIVAALLICSLTIHTVKIIIVLDLKMWKWGVLILVLSCGRMVSGWCIISLAFFIKRNAYLRRHVLYFVYELRNSIQNCVWLTLVLMTWECLFDKHIRRLADDNILLPVGKILICIVVGATIWTLKTLLVKILAPSFHSRTFFDRIQGTLFDQYIIHTLCGFPLVESEPGKEAKNEIVMGIIVELLQQFNQQNISASIMNELMNIVPKWVISTENQSKETAEKIFSNVAKPEFEYIDIDDLRRYLPEDDALKMMQLFEKENELERISKRVLKNWLVNALIERRALMLSLDDMKTVVDELHQVLKVLVGVIIFDVCLVIFRVETGYIVNFVSFQLLLVLVFRYLLQVTYDCVRFLFVKQPFDVGDRVEVDGVKLLVEKICIFSTVFLVEDKQTAKEKMTYQTITYQNNVLSTKSFHNYSRKRDMKALIEFWIHASTPITKISSLKEKLTAYVDNNSDQWHPSPVIVMQDVENNLIKSSITLTHKMNFDDMVEICIRRSLVIEEICIICQQLEIEVRF